MPRQTPCRARLWPSLWVPLALLLTGLATTAAVARLESAQARALAEARYQAQHLALVNRLLTLAPEHVGDDSPPSSWLPILFGDALPDDLGLRIDTLQRHTKTPLLELQTRHLDDPTRALRTEVQPGPYHWMLTTVPTEALLEGASRRVGARVWLAGLTLSLLASGLALLLCRRLARQAARIQALIASETRASRGISNLETEQSILRQALDDSETRSRDLVQLSGGLTSELDERGRIDFMSEQCADWLGRAPSDLAGTPFEALVSAVDRDNFRRTLSEAAATTRPQRLDLRLRAALAGDLAATVRVKAIKDPVHGLTGFRVTATPVGSRDT
ncbi:PAS domain-containing protein [Marinobacter lutaoensis]|uniref:PAS domain-containing protein n=1 Tax=Marinobacter lutaoensis TaxID=135739 RepID=A0A1V2DP86_9GAMM|nr:PAS domain-containing protein [Marinobacter lutaoensis]MBE02309.1 histidine kinase [Marinobacter sp.]MBI43781.1 histidine kinase [Oceanospirillales bacterium]ONF42231.1 hypothetical protein BTO32_16830 [Marinobacter lutaoensis]